MPRAIKTPVSVKIEFRFLRPKSHFTKDGTLRDNCREQRVSLGTVGAQACGDGDNLEKAVWDALQAKGVFENDIQIWDRASCSIWVNEPKLEGVTITLSTDEPITTPTIPTYEEKPGRRPTTID